jgi:UDP-glucose 4-epimerase
MTGVSNEISDGIFFSTVIQGRNITIQLPQIIATALEGLPRASPVFAGRDEDLDRLLAQFDPGPARQATAGPVPVVVVTAVGGLAGVGKTELAVQAARRAQARGWFPGGTLFVDMFGYDPARRVIPGQALEGFLRALGVPGEHIPPETQDRNRLYTSILASYAEHGQRLLVIIDNASAHDQVRPLLPADGHTGAIITSRHTLGMLDARLLDLDTLPLDDAVELLHEALRLARPGDMRLLDSPEDTLRLAELCGGLPLALRIIAALLAHERDRPVAALAADLIDETGRLAGMSYGDRAVRAAFELSYRVLGLSEGRLFRLLSLNPGPEVSTQAVGVLAGLADARARRELESLARAHLIGRAAGPGRWRMHDLVRSFASDLVSADPERHATLERLLSWYAHSVNAADMVMRPGRIRPDIGFYSGARLAAFRSRNEALAWCSAEQANLAASVRSAQAEGLGRLTWSIPLSMWGFLTQTLAWADWIEAHCAAARAAEECGALSGQGWLLNNLGTGYRALGRKQESRSAFAAGLAVRRRLGDLHGQADSLKDMAMAARIWEEFDEALRLSQETLAIIEMLTVPDRSGKASTLDTIATCLSRLGRIGEAASAATEALAIWEDVGGTRDDRGWARTRMLLGDITRQQGNLDEAIISYQAALDVFRQIDDHWGQADTLRRLGSSFADRGEVSLALRHLEQARECYERLGASELAEETELEIGQLSSGDAGLDERMRVLVTGAAGYVGRAVLHELMAAGDEVTALVHETDAGFPPAAEKRKADLLDPAALAAALEGVDGICHLAGLRGVRESVACPALYYRVNVGGTASLLEALAAQSRRRSVKGSFVLASTSQVYGAPAQQPISEDADLTFINPYAASKAACEQLVGWQAATGAIGATTLRIFNAAGSAAGVGDRDLSRIIPKAVAVAAGAAPAVEIYGPGTAIRDFVDVKDVARAFGAALHANDPGRHAVYNVGATPASVLDVIAAVKRVSGRDVPVEHRPAHDAEAPTLTADTSRIRAGLTWRPASSSLEQIVQGQWLYYATREA